MRVLFVLFLLLSLVALVLTRVSSTPVKQSAECLICIASAATAGEIVKIKPTEDAILFFAKFICKYVGGQPWTVCDGITESFRDEFFYVFRNLANEPTRICAALIPGCGDPTDPLGEGWQIDLPPPPSSPILSKRKKNIREPCRILQLTDIHVDYYYLPGSEAECSNPVCCRPDKTPKKPRRLLSSPAGFWGTIGKCDIPYHTVHHMLQHINQTEKIDYVIVSGDMINHVDWKYTMDGHIRALRNITSLVKNAFPGTPIYWAIGNHEGVPVNSFAPHSVDEEFWPTKLYDELSLMNGDFVVDEDNSTLYRGSWSARPIDGLRLISINTGFCINTNFFLYLNQSDPDGTMSWFINELLKAEKAGEKVHVLGHIPPGYSDCLEGWSRNYYRVVQRFHNTIVGQFFGHVHYDYWSMFYEDMHDTSSPAIGVLHASPSVTTFDYLNPAYRIYTVDANTFNLIDFDTYSTDLSATNESVPPVWTRLYSAKRDYHMRDLSPIEWDSLTQRILDSPSFQNTFFQRSFRVPSPKCDAACRHSMLCLLRSAHHNDTLYCPPSMLETNRP